MKISLYGRKFMNTNGRDRDRMRYREERTKPHLNDYPFGERVATSRMREMFFRSFK